MILDVIDRKIRESFSQAAIQYDVLTSLHREIGRELIAKINKIQDASYILDVGMGTGKLSKRLTFYFPDAQVIGIDSAYGMVKQSKQEHDPYFCIQADARALPFREGTFDIVASNLAYQWIDDLDKAFCDVKGLMKDNGTFITTLFGFNTLKEFFHSLDQVSDQPQIIKRLPRKEEVEKALLKNGFKNVEVDYELIKVHFPSLLSLLKWVRDIGAGSLEKNFTFRKYLYSDINEYYEQHYKERLGVVATFEIIWLQAQK